MKAVMAFAGKAAAAGGKAGASGGGGSVGAGGGTPFSGKSLGGMSRGVSLLGSLSEFAGARQKAAATDQEARDEAMAGRQEYITADERVNAIDAQYNALIGDQMAAASVMGIDVGSGSVIAARTNARDEAERERRIIRNGADMNAKLRKVRSLGLRQAAKNQRFGATLKLGLDVASSFMPMGG